MEQYILHLVVMLGILSILAYSMNLIVGYGGLITFCHAAFYGIGAYAYTLLTIESGGSSAAQDLLLTGSFSFISATLLSAVVTASLALLIGIVALRFRGELFVLSSLGFQMIVFVILYNWEALGRGPLGIYAIPRPELLGWSVNQPWEYASLAALANIILLPILFLLYRSPFGLSLKGLREDERAAESLGISAFQQQLSAFTIAGGYAGIAGALFASYVTYIDPSSFTLRESIFLVTLVLLGGTGNMKGPITGALAMTVLPEILRFVGLPDAIAPNVREMAYGLTLVALMYWRPQGINGEFAVR